MKNDKESPNNEDHAHTLLPPVIFHTSKRWKNQLNKLTVQIDEIVYTIDHTPPITYMKICSRQMNRERADSWRLCRSVYWPCSGASSERVYICKTTWMLEDLYRKRQCIAHLAHKCRSYGKAGTGTGVGCAAVHKRLLGQFRGRACVGGSPCETYRGRFS